ncbi:MAG: hypothetical protein WCA36_03205 [Pseudolabrys sp.]|jgi:hypothetical protein
MRLGHLAAVIVLVAFPFVATAQQSGAPKAPNETQNKAPKPTTAAAQQVVKIISADKAKQKVYCDMAVLEDQFDAAQNKKDTKAAEAIADKMDAMAERLGPEYVALMDGLQDLPEDSKEGEAIAETLADLDNMCGK